MTATTPRKFALPKEKVMYGFTLPFLVERSRKDGAFCDEGKKKEKSIKPKYNKGQNT